MIPVYDKKGLPIEEYDILKVYHYTNYRYKKCYMYKQVRIREGELFARHLMSDDPDSGYYLFRDRYDSAKNHLTDTEIVQCLDNDKLD